MTIKGNVASQSVLWILSISSQKALIAMGQVTPFADNNGAMHLC